MAECEACEWIKNSPKIYEDAKAVAILAPKSINPGHIIVMPKAHYTIMEQVPDYEIPLLAKIANKLSVALFESMKIQGTNILIQNGLASHQNIPHFMIHVIPRMENDGHNFLWKPRQLSEEEMSSVEMQLKDSAKSIGNFEKEKPKPVVLDKPPEQIKVPPKPESGDGKEEEVNYLIRQLERIP